MLRHDSFDLQSQFNRTRRDRGLPPKHDSVAEAIRPFVSSNVNFEVCEVDIASPQATLLPTFAFPVIALIDSTMSHFILQSYSTASGHIVPCIANVFIGRRCHCVAENN